MSNTCCRQVAIDPLEELITLFLLPILATWRVSHLLWGEDGPWGLVARLRGWAERRGVRLFDCFYCLSLWVALPAALLVTRTFPDWLMAWLGFSGAAILLERLTTAPAATWRENAPPDPPE